jgi:UDPglucose 6-dehydrogenase
MNLSVIGTGYVGLVQGVIMADFGHNVICMDVDEKKIENLRNGIIPIYEPGLTELLEKNIRDGRISFTTEMKKTTENSDVIFIAVGTPPQDDGSADLKYVYKVAENIGKYINNYKVIVNKSTVPVGTGAGVSTIITQEIEKRGKKIDFSVASNTEFLREGKAVRYCQIPDRVVIGANDSKVYDIMRKVYNVLFINKTPFVETNIETAEMIKYASNSFLAVKISFINEMALLAEKVGANIQEIANAMGMDGRISPKFLHAGPGFGGSCFPKDTKAIVDIAKQHGEEMQVVKASITANEKQKRKVVQKILNTTPDLHGKTIAILGLSFKPDTDDMRDAPSIDIIENLVEEGAKIKAFCPKGMEESKFRLKHLEKHISYCKNEYQAAENSDILILITEWNQFRGLNLEQIQNSMNDNLFFDLRNVFVKDIDVRKTFRYFPIGRK